MDPNPYESPQHPGEPPETKARAFWLDTLYLLLWGAILYLPAVILCFVVVIAFQQLSDPQNLPITILVGLCLFLVARICWRYWPRSKPISK
jgi:hypothetical protein